VTMIPNIHNPTVVFPLKENKHDQLAVHQYARHGKKIQSIFYENLGKELHNLRKAFDEELRPKNYQSLKYEDLCAPKC
ncbi:hypothetical protein HAX54_009467, partial [Datura stramonium]|nr:hypothetical protein [Datura stramonium]